MSEKSNADKAGPATPEKPPVDPIGGFKRDDYRLRALESRHETQMEIVKTRAWTGVLRLAILSFVVGLVLVYAMATGVPPPWELALSLLLGKAPGH